MVTLIFTCLLYTSLCRGELFSVGLFFFQCQPFSLRKDFIISEYQIYEETFRFVRDYEGEVPGAGVLQFGAAGKDGFGYVIAQRTTYAGNFQAMCQPVVYE